MSMGRTRGGEAVLEHGADVGARTEDGRTPSDLTDKPEILAILNGEQ